MKYILVTVFGYIVPVGIFIYINRFCNGFVACRMLYVVIGLMNLVKRIKWKVLELLETSDSQLRNTSNQSSELTEYESYLLIITHKVVFQLVKKGFSLKRSKDVKVIENIKKLFSNSGQSFNIYEITYNQYLTKNIAKT